MTTSKTGFVYSPQVGSRNGPNQPKRIDSFRLSAMEKKVNKSSAFEAFRKQ